MPSAAPANTSPNLANYGWVGLLSLVGWQVFTTPLTDVVVIGLAAAIVVASTLPALQWAKNRTDGLPAFELMMLTFIPFYAMPLLRGHPATLQFGNDILTISAVAVLTYQLACIAGYRAIGGRPTKSRMWTTSILQENNLQLGRIGVFTTTVFVYLQNFTEVIPSEIMTILRALFFGIGTVSIFLVSRMWGEGRIAPSDKFTLAIVLFAQTVILASQLYLITIASTVLMALIGYITASRKIPMVFVGVVFVTFAVLHNGKDEMRQIYWAEGYVGELTVGDLPDYYIQWIEFGLQKDDENEQEMASGILERASLFQIMCEITRKSPDNLPYLNGETYTSLPLLVVPRILWPDKPRPHESNMKLAVYYGFTSAAAAESVSIAFGIPSEAYANFGLMGSAIVGFAMGGLFKKVGRWSQNATPISLAGLAQVLLIAWSFQAEMTMAVWLSSLYQACVALLGIPWAYRYFITGQ